MPDKDVVHGMAVSVVVDVVMVHLFLALVHHIIPNVAVDTCHRQPVPYILIMIALQIHVSVIMAMFCLGVNAFHKMNIVRIFTVLTPNTIF